MRLLFYDEKILFFFFWTDKGFNSGRKVFRDKFFIFAATRENFNIWYYEHSLKIYNYLEICLF